MSCEAKRCMFVKMFKVKMPRVFFFFCSWALFLFAVWILTAPIHCIASVGEQVMKSFSKSVLIKKLFYIFAGLSVGKVYVFIFA